MYAKLFRSLTMSSIWSEDKDTRILWTTMLAEADAEGFIFGAIPGLANVARLTIPETKAALAKLMAPDPDSGDLARNPENEGRRVQEIQGGWRLVNYVHYRDIHDQEVRRAQYRESKRRKRSIGVDGPHMSTDVHTSPPKSTPVHPSDAAQMQLNSDADASQRKKRTPSPTPSGGRGDDEAISRIFAHYRKRFGKRDPYSLTPKRRQKIAARLDEIGEEACITAITRASEDNWFRETCSSNGVETILRSQDEAEKWASRPRRGESVQTEPDDDGWMAWAAEKQREQASWNKEDPEEVTPDE